MKKIVLALSLYIFLNACNGGGGSEEVVVDSLPENQSFFDQPSDSDTVYPQTDTTSFEKEPEKAPDTTKGGK